MPEVTPLVDRGGFAPDANLIKQCEALLQMAKEGKLRGMGYGIVIADGYNESGFVQYNITCGPNVTFAMSHALTTLHLEWFELVRKKGTIVPNPGDPTH